MIKWKARLISLIPKEKLNIFVQLYFAGTGGYHCANYLPLPTFEISPSPAKYIPSGLPNSLGMA